MEAKCIIGAPIRDSIDDSVIKGVHAYYDKVILPTIKELNLLERTSLIFKENSYNELQ